MYYDNTMHYSTSRIKDCRCGPLVNYVLIGQRITITMRPLFGMRSREEFNEDDSDERFRFFYNEMCKTIFSVAKLINLALNCAISSLTRTT